MSDKRREFDILVIGSTGYTGKLVIAALQSTTWRYAISGRNQTKLDEVVKSLAKDRTQPAATLVIDSTKTESLLETVRRARLVIACAGPFHSVGMPVVDACVACGTHYVDITGEVQFVRAVVEKHDAASREKNIFVVPCSGFDCVASDMANHYLHRLAEGRNKSIAAVEAGFQLKGGPSRGTMESSMQFVQTATRQDLHPLCLVPPKDRKGMKLPAPQSGVAFHEGFKQYRGPFVMAVINERVVRRSDYLAQRKSAYSEVMLGTWKQCQTANYSQVSYAAMKYSFGRALLRRFVFPGEGAGPTEEQKQRSSFKVRLIGKSENGAAAVGCHMSYPKDAYTFTGMSAVEVASALLNDEINSNAKAGVVTPAYAVGDALIRRLGDKGVKFQAKL